MFQPTHLQNKPCHSNRLATLNQIRCHSQRLISPYNRSQHAPRADVSIDRFGAKKFLTQIQNLFQIIIKNNLNLFKKIY